MGATVSISQNVGSGGDSDGDSDGVGELPKFNKGRRGSKVHHNSRVRNSVFMNADYKKQLAEAAGGETNLRLNNVSEIQENVFQVEVPPGVIPGGTFSAICGDRYVRVQVPEDCVTGDLIEIDLSEIIKAEQEKAKEISDHAGEAQPNDNLTVQNVDEQLKHAAALFMKYDKEKKYAITMKQLGEILEKEFQFPPGSEAIQREMAIADIDRSQTLSFDEFRHWLEHLQMRLEVHKLEERRKELSNVSQVDLMEGEERLKKLHDEQEAIRAQIERQKQEFQEELEALRKEKERLEKARKDFEDGSEELERLNSYDSRNEQKMRIMAQHHQTNEELIEKMKQDYMMFRDMVENTKHQQKEEQRKRIEKRKLENQKKAQTAKSHEIRCEACRAKKIAECRCKAELGDQSLPVDGEGEEAAQENSEPLPTPRESPKPAATEE